MSAADDRTGTAERRFIGLREAARRTGFSHSTIRRWIAEGRLNAYQPGRQTVVEVEVLDRLVLQAVRPAVSGT